MIDLKKRRGGGTKRQENSSLVSIYSTCEEMVFWMNKRNEVEVRERTLASRNDDYHQLDSKQNIKIQSRNQEMLGNNALPAMLQSLWWPPLSPSFVSRRSPPTSPVPFSLPRRSRCARLNNTLARPLDIFSTPPQRFLMFTAGTRCGMRPAFLSPTSQCSSSATSKSQQSWYISNASRIP